MRQAQESEHSQWRVKYMIHYNVFDLSAARVGGPRVYRCPNRAGRQFIRMEMKRIQGTVDNQTDRGEEYAQQEERPGETAPVVIVP